jgi:PAS domain-containing protein
MPGRGATVILTCLGATGSGTRRFAQPLWKPRKADSMGIKELDDGERLRLLINNVVDYAIYILDLDGRIVSWNSGAQRLKGYTADEIIG